MIRKACALLAAALLAGAAGPAPKAPAAKPAAAKPAPAKSAASKPAAQGPYDAQDPASLIALLASLDAKAEVTRKEGDAVILKVTSPAGGFEAQMAGCNAQGRACAAMQFDASAERASPTLPQINSFNQTSIACRIVQDRGGKAHVLYSALVFASDSRQDALTHIAAWRGCLGDFGAFLKDPTGYLASAP